jgi:hypothetical protein
MLFIEELFIKKAEIYDAAEVLFVTDDPGIFDAAIVVIEHIDIKSVFVIREIHGVTGAGRAAFVVAEFRIIQIEEGSGGDGDGIFTHQDGHRFYGRVWGLADDAAIIRFAVDAEEVIFLHHQLMFGGGEDTGLYDDLDIVVLEGHEVDPKVFYRDGLELGFSDTFIEGGECEAGDIVADVLFADLVEVVFFVAEVGEIEVLGETGKSAEDQEETGDEAHRRHYL